MVRIEKSEEYIGRLDVTTLQYTYCIESGIVPPSLVSYYVEAHTQK